MPTIEVNHVTKEYRLGHLTRFKDNLKWVMSKMRGQKAPGRTPFKALDDINLNVEQGEVVGIIGPNGAGKSTLLKILSSVVRPTCGSIHVEGKVAPLIEVGAGLVGDLTGRENIFLNSSILGIPRSEIKKKLDEIISFAELEEFIDTPIKRYSSGMKVKLGFSIATSIDADILIVDEVLAVGDLAFQRKCFDRMEELIKRRGNTVLLVSHNIRQVQRLCSRVIMLDQGKVYADAEPKTVCDIFYEKSDQKIISQNNSDFGLRSLRTSGDVELVGIELLDDSGKPMPAAHHKGNVIVSLHIRVLHLLTEPAFDVGIHTTDFLYLATHNSEQQFHLEDLELGEYLVQIKLHKIPLLPGVYSLRLRITNGLAAATIFYAENLFPFQVVEDQEPLSAAIRDGIFSLDASWSPPNLITKEYKT